MLSFITSSKNSNIQIEENNIELANLIYAPGSELKATAQYGKGTLDFQLKLGLGSLMGMHKIEIVKNGQACGRIEFDYFKNAKIFWMDQAIESVYKAKKKKKYTCLVSDESGDLLMEVLYDYKILESKTDFSLKLKESFKEANNSWLELLLIGLFCTNIICSDKATAG